MRVLVSGGTGLVGRYIVNGLLTAGYGVSVGGRAPPLPDWFVRPVEFRPLTLEPGRDQRAVFRGVEGYVHAAFDHLPGRYRDGEGDDPARFRRLNVDGTIDLLKDAKSAGVRRAVFLSSRAVYDGLPEGRTLDETAALAPTSLYGRAKLESEQAVKHLGEPDYVTTSLRLTGVYGDLRPNKWEGLFTDYLAGKPIASRVASEVHGRDVALGVQLILEAKASDVGGEVFNMSDILVDRADILASLQAASASNHPLPDRSDPDAVRVMPTQKLAALGWHPGGKPLLNKTLEALAKAHAAT